MNWLMQNAHHEEGTDRSRHLTSPLRSPRMSADHSHLLVPLMQAEAIED